MNKPEQSAGTGIFSAVVAVGTTIGGFFAMIRGAVSAFRDMMRRLEQTESRLEDQGRKLEQSHADRNILRDDIDRLTRQNADQQARIQSLEQTRDALVSELQAKSTQLASANDRIRLLEDGSLSAIADDTGHLSGRIQDTK